jgi:hypothetical protein
MAAICEHVSGWGAGLGAFDAVSRQVDVSASRPAAYGMTLTSLLAGVEYESQYESWKTMK